MMEQFKNLVAFLVGLFIALLFLEIVLYCLEISPGAIQHHDFFLKKNYSVKQINPPGIGLDSLVYNRYNSWGFRGKEPPENHNDQCTILAVGGSTTACTDIDEGKDWIHQLQKLVNSDTQQQIWVNNAGIVGHSTFGHIQLLEEHVAQLQPDIILFLIGINDVERKDLHKHDLANASDRYTGMKDWLKKNSRIIAWLLAYTQQFRTIKINVDEGRKLLLHPSYVNIDTFQMSRALMEQSPYLKDFENRLKKLLRLTQQIGTKPILITQPLLFGEGIDPYKQIDLARIKSNRFENGLTYWKVLELYNDVTRKVGLEKQIQVIDLARKMPKDSRYFGDCMHFTNAGVEKVASIIWKEGADSISDYCEY